MKLSAPKNGTFIISVFLIVGGFILAFANPFGVVEGGILYHLIIFAGGALLALGNLLKGL